MIIYRLISPSKKSYIGKTSIGFEKRLTSHIKNYLYAKKNNKKSNHRKLYYAFNKYNPPILQNKSLNPNWKIEILYSCLNLEELNEKEKFFIKYYDSINHGYNITEGGDGINGGKKLSESHKKNIGDSNYKKYTEKCLSIGIAPALRKEKKIQNHQKWAKPTGFGEKIKLENYKRWSNLEYKERVSKNMKKPHKKNKVFKHKYSI